MREERKKNAKNTPQNSSLLGEEKDKTQRVFSSCRAKRRGREKDDALSAKHARHDHRIGSGGGDEFWSRGAWVQRRARRAGARRTPFFFFFCSLFVFDHLRSRGLTGKCAS